MPVNPGPERAGVQAAFESVAFGTGDAQMQVVIVRQGFGGLMKNLACALDEVRIFAEFKSMGE